MLMGRIMLFSMAIDQEDKDKVINWLNDGDDQDENDDPGDYAAHTPDFEVTVENSYLIHHILKFLAQDDPKLAALGTIIIGKQEASGLAAGIQYFHSAEDIREMAAAYRKISPEALALAIQQALDFLEPDHHADLEPNFFTVICDELDIVADNEWHMISGMY